MRKRGKRRKAKICLFCWKRFNSIWRGNHFEVQVKNRNRPASCSIARQTFDISLGFDAFTMIVLQKNTLFKIYYIDNAVVFPPCSICNVTILHNCRMIYELHVMNCCSRRQNRRKRTTIYLEAAKVTTTLW